MRAAGRHSRSAARPLVDSQRASQTREVPSGLELPPVQRTVFAARERPLECPTRHCLNHCCKQSPPARHWARQHRGPTKPTRIPMNRLMTLCLVGALATIASRTGAAQQQAGPGAAALTKPEAIDGATRTAVLAARDAILARVVRERHGGAQAFATALDNRGRRPWLGIPRRDRRGVVTLGNRGSPARCHSLRRYPYSRERQRGRRLLQLHDGDRAPRPAKHGHGQRIRSLRPHRRHLAKPILVPRTTLGARRFPNEILVHAMRARPSRRCDARRARRACRSRTRT